jgi:hypothetical protein
MNEELFAMPWFSCQSRGKPRVEGPFWKSRCQSWALGMWELGMKGEWRSRWGFSGLCSSLPLPNSPCWVLTQAFQGIPAKEARR